MAGYQAARGQPELGLALVGSLVEAVILLFIVIDPLGVSPYIAALLSRAEKGLRPAIVRRAIIAALAILLGFALLGEAVMGAEIFFMIRG